MSRRGIIMEALHRIVSGFRGRAHDEARLFKGTDYLGNQYFEIPPDPSRGKRYPTRMFVPPYGQNTDIDETQLPYEWSSWLRRQRIDPPTDEEIQRNLAIAEMKKRKAAELEEKEKKLFPEFAKKLEEQRKKERTTRLEGGYLNYPIHKEYTQDSTKGLPNNEEIEKKKQQQLDEIERFR